MHMADALLSPTVGALGWATAVGFSAYSARQLAKSPEAGRPALMGVLGAFIFAGQMVNFTIPGTGSSGHIGGGILLASLLGPHAAFLVMVSVLTVQALLFADGGLLALGCNIVNLGVFTCYLAYPMILRALTNGSRSPRRLTLAVTLAVIVGLLLGAFSVVLETTLSGISELPFGTFVLFMMPVHLGIGLVEGLVTAGVLIYVWKSRPDLLQVGSAVPKSTRSMRPLLVTFAVLATIVGGSLSWFASTHPDGLEWSMAKVTGREDLGSTRQGIHRWLSSLQEKTALLPDYSLGATEEGNAGEEPRWPAPDAGTSVSGVLGAGLTLLLSLGIGGGLLLLRSRVRTGKVPTQSL